MRRVEIGRILIAISCVMMIGAGGHGASICESDLEALASANLTVSYPQVVKNQLQRQMRQNGMAISLNDNGLLDLLNLKLDQAPQIVILSFSAFLGDNSIFYFSLINYFRRQYPNTPIKVISPKSRALRPSSQFAIANIDVRFLDSGTKATRDEKLRQFIKRMPGLLKSEIQPGAFVLYDLTTIDKAEEAIGDRDQEFERRPSQELSRVLNDLGSQALGVSLLRNGRISRSISAIELIVPNQNFPLRLSSLPNVRTLLSRSEKKQGLRLNLDLDESEPTLYQAWLNQMSLIFGDKVFLSWDFNQLSGSEYGPSEVENFLEQSGLSKTKPYGWISLNTLGTNKVAELTPVYVKTLESLVEHQLAKNPDMQLLVSFPEAQFGPEVQTQVLELVSRYRHYVALVPAGERELAPSLARQASWVVSYDSGLVHLSAFRDSRDVLTVSLSKGQSEFWRRPNQPYVQILAHEDPSQLGARINQWLDKRNRKNFGMSVADQFARRTTWLINLFKGQ